MYPLRGNNDDKLDALFRAYRGACPDPDASPNFMPNLWTRIESRQTFLFSFRRMANGFVTAAVALSIALGVYLTIPRSTPGSTEGYLEALADAHPLETPDLIGPLPIDLNRR